MTRPRTPYLNTADLAFSKIQSIVLVMVDDQHLPVLAFLAVTAHDALAAVLDRHPAAGSPEGVGAGIDRVRQHVM